MSKREEVLPRYIFASPPYYWNSQKNEKFGQKSQNFEPLIHYVIEQKVETQGIRMFKGVEPVLLTRQEIVILPKAKPIVAKGILVVIRVRYNEPRFN